MADGAGVAMTAFARLAGGILCILAIGLWLLALRILYVLVTVPEASRAEWIAVTGLAVFAAPCSIIGLRLVFNRPNLHGSALSPVAWRLLSLLFIIVGATLVIVAARHAQLLLILGATPTFLIAYWCQLAARGAVILERPSPVFPANTSLIEKGGFAPPDFRYGLEILNDPTSKMDFVVSVLREDVGMEEAEAIKTMLHIHQQGGVLIPTSSFDDAQRMAEAIQRKARGQHPLVCRAVQASTADVR